MTQILLGYEVPTGMPVFIEPQHLGVFGMTQLSGKTTTLEAIITRSGKRAIAFITKRGESGFSHYHMMQPYYKEQTEWRYVEALVNTALGEKVKYEPRMRWAIMQVSKGAKTLKDVYENAKRLLTKATKEWDKEVYGKLIEYLDLVMPDLSRVPFATTIELKNGINVVSLIDFKLETQQLIIASTLRYVYENMTDTIVIVPEAWEHLPQARMTPVKFVAEQFIRKGASVHNYLWLDSQDLGGIDKTPLRQVSTWIMGRMMEAHEVERVLKQLLGFKVPAQEIQTLPLGVFYVTVGDKVVKTYVVPAGVPESFGREVALGKRTPEDVKEFLMKQKVPYPSVSEEMVREQTKEIERLNNDVLGLVTERDALRSENTSLKKHQTELEETIDENVQRILDLEEKVKMLEPLLPLQTAIQGIVDDKLAKAPHVEGSNIQGVASPSEIVVNQQQPKIIVTKTLKTLELKDSDLQGKLAILYAEEQIPVGAWFTLSKVKQAMESHGWQWDPRTDATMLQMCGWGFFETRRLSHKAREYRTLMSPTEARQKGLLETREAKA